MALDRLSSEDAQILKLGRDVIRGHTCKVLILERTAGGPLPTVHAIREHVDARLDAAPRLRRRVVATPLHVANPVWLDDPDFDISRHITRVPTDSAVSRKQLDEIIARLMASRLDRSHPLWHLDVVDELEDRSMALIWRIHHCLADGTTSVALGSALLWSEDPDVTPLPPCQWRADASPSAATLFAHGVRDRVRMRNRDGAEAARRTTSLRLLGHTMRNDLGRNAALTPLGQRVSSARTVAFAAAPLEGCRRAGKAVAEAVTVNDVVLAIVAGGVRAWLERGMGPTDGIRVKVPVSLHRQDEMAGISNRNSYFFVGLPVTEPDPVKRVLLINKETTQRKLDHDAETLYRLGRHPFVAHWAMSPRVFTFNVSNVRGPTGELFVLGSRLRELYSIAEIAQHHALRVSVITAAGSLFFGLCADRDHVENLDVLADGLRRASDELLALVG